MVAFDAFDDFNDFAKSINYGTSETCQECGSNPCRGATTFDLVIYKQFFLEELGHIQSGMDLKIESVPGSDALCALICASKRLTQLQPKSVDQKQIAAGC